MLHIFNYCISVVEVPLRILGLILSFSFLGTEMRWLPALMTSWSSLIPFSIYPTQLTNLILSSFNDDNKILFIMTPILELTIVVLWFNVRGFTTHPRDTSKILALLGKPQLHLLHFDREGFILIPERLNLINSPHLVLSFIHQNFFDIVSSMTFNIQVVVLDIDFSSVGCNLILE